MCPNERSKTHEQYERHGIERRYGCVAEMLEARRGERFPNDYRDGSHTAGPEDPLSGTIDRHPKTTPRLVRSVAIHALKNARSAGAERFSHGAPSDSVPRLSEGVEDGPLAREWPGREKESLTERSVFHFHPAEPSTGLDR